MPNWCYTQINFYSSSKATVEYIHNKLEVFINEPFCDKTTNNTYWLGNILGNAGFSYEAITAGKYGCVRGWIQFIFDIELNAKTGIYSFYVDIEDAWSPNIKPWRYSLNKLCTTDEVKLAYIAEEPGCCIYEKYDPDGLFYSNYEYNLDCYVPDASCWAKYPELVDKHAAFTADEVCKLFKVDSIEKALARADTISKAMQEEFGDGFYSINPYEILEEEY